MTDFEKQIYIAKQINRAVQMTLQSADLDDTNAMEVADLYPVWEIGKVYPQGFILRHGVNDDGEAQLYRVSQEHTSQGDWTPDKTPALYSKIGFADDGTPIWTQPLGGHDAYQKGDKVIHKDKTWVSMVDGNVWEPGVYGWEEA